MAKKMKKAIPWFLVATVLMVGLVGLNVLVKNTKAATPSTDVTINNEVPAFVGNAVESPSSHNGAGEGDTAGNPTNEGSDVTFQATANDPNGDDYYLAVCTTDAVTAGTGGGAPTCDVATWCISTSTTDEDEASCTYTTLNGDPEPNTWYAFVCDAASSGQLCSSENHGTGDSGTPFYVNHDPSFSAYATADGNPGATAAVTSTAADTDSDAAADTVSLYVCDAAGFTAGGSPSCTGTLLCSHIAAASNPTCNITIAAVKPDGEWTAYGYVIDNHGLASSGAKYNTDEPYTVNNVAPAISAATIALADPGGGDLNLTVSGADTTGFTVVFTVTDANSCVTKGGTPNTDNEIVSAIVNVYRSGVGSATCDEVGEYDTDNCYPEASAWTPVCDQDAAECTDDTDNTVDWTCTFPLGFHADSTVANTPNSAEDWEAAVQADDDDALNSGLVTQVTGTQGTEMATFMSFSLTTGNINYGSLDTGEDSAQQTSTLQAKGNVGIDEELSGVNMVLSGNGVFIEVGQQKYDLETGIAWGDMNGDGDDTGILTVSAYETELDCAKPTHASATPTANTYWKLRVPDEQTAGAYSGTNTINGITGDDWTA